MISSANSQVRTLKLASVSDKIRTGDVLLFRGTGLISRVIQFWTRSVYSHVGIILWVSIPPVSRLSVIEATWPWGIRIYPLDYYLEQCQRRKVLVDWYVLKNSVDNQKFVGYLLEQWGKHYASIWQFIWSFGWLSSLVRRRSGKGADTSSSRYFCSELCSAALRHAGYVPDEEQEPALTDPGAIARYSCLARVGILSIQV